MEAPITISNATRRTAYILSGIAIAFLLFDSIIHIMAIEPVIKSSGELGYPVDTIQSLGYIELLCVILYAIPKTSFTGAVLLTGYLGGAISTQLRIGAPLFSTALFPIYVGLLIWGGLYLRDWKLRNMIPVRQD